MRRHPYDAAADAEIAKVPGARAVAREIRGKHRVLVIGLGDRTRSVFHPHSPGDGVRGAKKHACDVRRVLRELILPGPPDPG